MKIFLRPITLEDGEMIVKWRNSENIRNHCFDKTIVTLESNALFYKNYIETGKYKQFIVNRVDDDFSMISYAIASIYLKDIDNVNHRCELCIFTSDDEEWNSESQAIAIKMMIEKAFNEYNIHKIYSYVISNNKDEIALLKNAGFKEEGLLKKEALSLDGKYIDVVRMCVINE